VENAALKLDNSKNKRRTRVYYPVFIMFILKVFVLVNNPLARLFVLALFKITMGKSALLFILFLIISVHGAFGQLISQQQSDSLNSSLANSKQDTIKVKNLLDLAYFQLYTAGNSKKGLIAHLRILSKRQR